MIIQENVNINGNNFIFTYSNNRHKIRQIGTGIVYDEAYDLVQYPMIYEETDELIEVDNNGNTED